MLFGLIQKVEVLKKHHNFLWLSLIDRKTDGKNIQKIIYLWMLKYSSFKKNIWESGTLCSRVISWILNIDIIINNGTFDFKKNFFQNIVNQCNHLRRNIRFERNPLIKVQILTTLILSGLVFKEYEENYKVAISEFEKFVKYYYDEDGFPLSRNPNDLIFLTKYLLLCSENIKDAQKYIPEFLENIINKNLICIKFIKTPEMKIPFFNGGYENEITKFEEFIKELKISKKDKKKVIGGLFYMKSKSQNLYFDVGSPPIKRFSSSYQSGPLSFEYYLDGKKIITNSGFGSNISTKAELISKLSASQSTLTINDTSINKFEKNKLINNIFGSSIKSSFKTFELKFEDNDSSIGCSVQHDGYQKNFGCVHKREIYIDKENNKLKGVDHIYKKSDGVPIRYVFRFHLNPDLTAIKTMSGNSALIQISKNKSVLFTVENENLEIEKSIFLGDKKILDNYCITIAGNLVNKDKSFNWEIRKKI